MKVTIAFAATLALLLAACSDTTVAPDSLSEATFSKQASPSGAALIDGRTGPGSLYRLARPANWNGDLLIYAHGYTSPDAPVALPAEGDAFIGLVGSQGIAVAFSSFSENGWAVKDGAQRTHQLLGLFTSKFGRPNRVYLGGASMGGLIAIRLAETYPKTYDGVLAACAVAGGTRENFDYHANVRLLFDFFYPGVLPGNATERPDGVSAVQIAALAIAAMTADEARGAVAIASFDQTPVPFANANELVESIVTAILANLSDLDDTVLTKGKDFFDNQSTIYTSPLPQLQAMLPLINTSVGRYSASPAALASFAQNYEPSGQLQMPMVMLSNARDPLVPGFNQLSYRDAVVAAGAGDLLVQRRVDNFGHCVFTAEESAKAFTDLAVWVQFGIKPTP